jgi:hypothetical protein
MVMKANLSFLSFVLIGCNLASGQANKIVKPVVQEKVVVKQSAKPALNTQPAQTDNSTPIIPNADLQKVEMFIGGNEGRKSSTTTVFINLMDGNQRQSAHYTGAGTVPTYFPGGDGNTYIFDVDGTVPVGVEQIGANPTTVTRDPVLYDFVKGGSVLIGIQSFKGSLPVTSQDTWKIGSFTLYLYFLKDPGTPHTITWNGFTISPDMPSRTLRFDKNFNPIQ